MLQRLPLQDLQLARSLRALQVPVDLAWDKSVNLLCTFLLAHTVANERRVASKQQQYLLCL